MAEYVIFRRRRACVCLAEWIPVFEKVLIKDKVINKNVDIAQLTGNAGASAGTHSKGGAADFWDLVKSIWRFLVIARQMGADATWHRTPKQGFNPPHFHLVLRGCPHNSPARYQITEVDNNQNGLVGSARDDGPRPLSKRTWREGLAWAKKYLGSGGPIDDWKAEIQTYEVVRDTSGYETMWSKPYLSTDRKPGYIIKTVGRSTKDPIGVATENDVWYRQSDLKKVGSGEHNYNDPNGYKLGITGKQILWLDQRLIIHGMLITPSMTMTQVDVNVVKAFQKKKGLYVDGIVGPNTIAALSKDPT